MTSPKPPFLARFAVPGLSYSSVAWASNPIGKLLLTTSYNTHATIAPMGLSCQLTSISTEESYQEISTDNLCDANQNLSCYQCSPQAFAQLPGLSNVIPSSHFSISSLQAQLKSLTESVASMGRLGEPREPIHLTYQSWEHGSFLLDNLTSPISTHLIVSWEKKKQTLLVLCVSQCCVSVTSCRMQPLEGEKTHCGSQLRGLQFTVRRLHCFLGYCGKTKLS